MKSIIHVAVVCTGNICRSPMGEVVFAQMVTEDDDLRGRVMVTSAGTANWHVGSDMDPRARAALNRAGFRAPGTPAAFANGAYLDGHDLVLVMTREQRDDVRGRLTSRVTEVTLVRDLIEPGLELDLADPYYGDAAEFDRCLETIRAAGRCLTTALRRRLGAGSFEA
jgi:protein-tyrosine phosphatase